MKKKSLHYALLACTICSLSCTSFASTKTTVFEAFPQPPRATLTDGSIDFTYGMGDVMLPIVGSDDAIIFADAQSKYGHDSSWFGALGTGI